MPKRVLSEEIAEHRIQLLIPWVKGTIKDEGYIHLNMTLGTLDAFINGSYRLESNPLPHLRKCFPDFIWRFQKPKDIGEVVSIVLKHDYTFAVGDCEEGLVTAKERNNSQYVRAVYYTDEDHHSFPESLEELEVIMVGACPAEAYQSE